MYFEHKDKILFWLMQKKIKIVLFVFLLSSNNLLFSNNLNISNSKTGEKNTVSKYQMIQFDISWENSWRTTNPPNNYDAVWVFAKYRIGKGEWHHCTLNNLDGSHIAPSGLYIETVTDGKGVFIYRSTTGSGNLNFSGVQLRWEYALDGVNDTDVVKIQVFGIEMVHINSGRFYIGDADGVNLSTASFYGSDGKSVYLWENLTQNIKVNANNYDDDTLEVYGIGLSSTGGLDRNNDGTIDNPDFPVGGNAFYCMKYEISQQQYVDFLNTLNRTQQNYRTEADVGSDSVQNRFVMCNSISPVGRNGIACAKDGNGTEAPIVFFCDLNNNGKANEADDGQNVACNYLSWEDGKAYADWAGLRPMSETEFEKICRGPENSTFGEYAWGTTSINSLQYSLTYSGRSTESLGINGSTGNALYYNTSPTELGAVRCGIFAEGTTTREQSGAAYYGVMEMSGNVAEQCVSLGLPQGRNFRGSMGDGELNSLGQATNSDWPQNNALGAGFRGGSLTETAENLRISYRLHASFSYSGRNRAYGFRCVR